MTGSGPYWSFADPELRAAIARATEEAVAAALQHVTRREGGGELHEHVLADAQGVGDAVSRSVLAEELGRLGYAVSAERFGLQAEGRHVIDSAPAIANAGGATAISPEMSTSEQRSDESMRRYRAGLPARDQSEREAYREWARLDADDREAALDERPDDEYNRYEGPLGWYEWLEERERTRRLERLGIEPVELPEPYGEALRGRRASSLARQVEDKLMNFAGSPLSREELAAHARGFGAAARPLDLDLSKRVVELEGRRDDLADQLFEAARHETYLQDLVKDGDAPERERARAELAPLEGIRQSLGEIRQELEALSTRSGHPDPWLAQHGDAIRDALAAKHQFRRMRELGTARDRGPQPSGVARELQGAPGRERTGGQAARETPAAGLEPPF